MPASTCMTSPASWSSCSATRSRTGSPPACQDLDYGDIDGICNAARIYPLAGVKKDELDTALGYRENNAPRMRCNWFRSCGLFVGSGAVGSGCKAVIGQRLKLSGMHWTVAGASAIATLRCQQASRSEDQICYAPRNQTPAA